MRLALLGAALLATLLAGCATEGPYNGYAYGYDSGYYGPGYYDYGYGPGYYYGPSYFGFSYYGGNGGDRWHHWDGGSRSWHQGSLRTEPQPSSRTVVQPRARSGNHFAQRGTAQTRHSAQVGRNTVRRDDTRRDRTEREPRRVAQAQHRAEPEHGS